MKLLALDISSTNIGYIVWDGDTVTLFGTIVIKGELFDRLIKAHPQIEALIDRAQPDAVAYEGPAYKTSAMAMIAQQRMVGIALLVAGLRRLPVMEIAPATAKKALTGAGNANKHIMQFHANQYADRVDVPFDEHQADALGVAMAAFGKMAYEVRKRAA
jgi:crossover junction endodeoxyribonuclease RuvC